MRRPRFAARLAAPLAAALAASAIAAAPPPAWAQAAPETVAPLNYQPFMNVFRRYDIEDEEALFAFYTDVMGFERMASAGAVHRWFAAGEQQVKLTRRTPDRSYVDGGVDDATGLRLLTFFYPDEAGVAARFEAAGLPAPDFAPVPGTTRSVARVQDPDGQWLELVVAPDEEAMWDRMEVGLTVSDLEASTDFYRGFVGLEEMAPEEDPVDGLAKHRFEHGATIVSLRQFGGDLPADTGGGGIQYVVSDVAVVDRLAKARDVVIDQPLSGLEGYALRTIWLDDPDGITNYFAQVGVPEE